MPLEITGEAFTPSEVVQRTVTNFAVTTLAGATGQYAFTLETPAGDPVDNTDLDTATLSLYDEETRSIINGRSNQDILGADEMEPNTGLNDVAISATSEFVWSISAEDNVIVDPTRTKRLEYHRAVFTIGYDVGNGSEILIHEVRFPIRRSFSAE